METSNQWFEENVPSEVSDSSIFKFNITIGDKKISVDMTSNLSIDYTVIQEQLADTPSIFAFWAAIYSEVRMTQSLLERKIKARKGYLVDNAIRDASKANTRLTDKQTQMIIDADKELTKLEAQLLIMQKNCGKLYFMIEAIRMKSDNLRSLAGFAKIDARNS